MEIGERMLWSRSMNNISVVTTSMLQWQRNNGSCNGNDQRRVNKKTSDKGPSAFQTLHSLAHSRQNLLIITCTYLHTYIYIYIYILLYIPISFYVENSLEIRGSLGCYGTATVAFSNTGETRNPWISLTVTIG